MYGIISVIISDVILVPFLLVCCAPSNGIVPDDVVAERERTVAGGESSNVYSSTSKSAEARALDFGLASCQRPQIVIMLCQ